MFTKMVGPKWNMVLFGLVIALIITAMNYPTFRSWMDKPPLVYNNVPFPVERDVRPGQVIPAFISRCNTDTSPLTYVVARSLYMMDKNGDYSLTIPMDEVHVEVSPGCTEGVSNLHVFPKTFAGDEIRSGTYVLEGTAIVTTQWKTHYVHWKTRPFHVIGNTS
jgi:hypothetical protein